MKKEVISFLENNCCSKKLFNIFKEEFKDGYHKLNKNDKNKIFNIREIIFKKWVYSPLIFETYITPSYLINNLAQSKYKGDYAIMLHGKLEENKDSTLNIKEEYIYYSMENHPIFKDLEKLIDYASPTIIMREENEYIIDGGENFLKSLNFENASYIIYLIDLALALGIIEEIASIRCTCYKVSDKYSDYNKLSQSDKFKKIFDKTIDIVSNKLRSMEIFDGIINRDLILSFLDNKVTEKDYLKIIDKIPKSIYEDINYAYQYEDSENNYEIKKIQDITGEDIAYLLISTQVRMNIDLFFTTVFGYYLGIIQPTQESVFLASQVFQDYAKSTDFMEQLGCTFICDVLHDLTPLGKAIMLEYKSQFNKNALKIIKRTEINRAIDEGIEEKTLIYKTREQYRDIFESEDILDVVKNVVKKHMDNEYMNEYEKDEEDSKFNSETFLNNTLVEFNFYLLDTEVNMNTAHDHLRNVEIFVVDYLKCKDINPIEKINSESVDDYFNDWFVTKVSQSKKVIKQHIKSMKKYIIFLQNKGIINEKKAEDINKILKKPGKYYNKLGIN